MDDAEIPTWALTWVEAKSDKGFKGLILCHLLKCLALSSTVDSLALDLGNKV